MARVTTLGVLMNTRGLMELVVLNAGYGLGVIPKNIFFILTLMAIVTTYMTAPLLRPLNLAAETRATVPLEMELRRTSAG